MLRFFPSIGAPRPLLRAAPALTTAEFRKPRTRPPESRRSAEASGAHRFGFLQFIAVEPERRIVFTDGSRAADDVVGAEFLHATVEFEPVGLDYRARALLLASQVEVEEGMVFADEHAGAHHPTA